MYPPLLSARLIDRLVLISFPVLLGKGKSIFGGHLDPGAMKLADSFVSKTGVVIGVYEPAGEVKTGSFETKEPSKEERETGMYDVLFAGATADGRSLRAGVSGDKDPGYGSTSKMLAEAALTLNDTSRQTTLGGVWTPAAAMGDTLIVRLQERAGLRFVLET